MASTAKVAQWCRLAIPALCTIVTICLFPVVGFPKTYTFYPIADATVHVGYDFNFGTELNLAVEPGVYSFLKFDLSPIPPAEKITGATFNAFCNQASKPYEFVVQLRAVADTNWTETGITGAPGNYPAIGEVIATYDDGRQGEYNQWTVDTVYLPRSLVTLGLSANSLVVYNSRENASNKPYLRSLLRKGQSCPVILTSIWESCPEGVSVIPGASTIAVR
jgi:hypothetical protein